MKRLILLTLVLSLVAGGASAGQYGIRGGLSVDPDQFHFGGHVDLGPVIETVRIVPNIEIGLGSHETWFTFNGDFIYDFPQTPWSVGGELGINVVNRDGPGSNDTDIGLSALGDYRVALSSGKTLLLEAKLGLSDSPNFKFTVGWNF